PRGVWAAFSTEMSVMMMNFVPSHPSASSFRFSSNHLAAQVPSTIHESHTIKSPLSMSSLRSVVVVAPTHVLVGNARDLARLGVEHGRTVEAVLQDRLDVPVRARAHRERA